MHDLPPFEGLESPMVANVAMLEQDGAAGMDDEGTFAFNTAAGGM